MLCVCCVLLLHRHDNESTMFGPAAKMLEGLQVGVFVTGVEDLGRKIFLGMWIIPRSTNVTRAHGIVEMTGRDPNIGVPVLGDIHHQEGILVLGVGSNGRIMRTAVLMHHRTIVEGNDTFLGMLQGFENLLAHLLQRHAVGIDVRDIHRPRLFVGKVAFDDILDLTHHQSTRGDLNSIKGGVLNDSILFGALIEDVHLGDIFKRVVVGVNGKLDLATVGVEGSRTGGNARIHLVDG
mmetsp:Transcript_22687/g.52439  ORF Transcript_22687/g.52439 Transcript_22687/m.52439 type:complete len:236 (-) Transcript_22687:1147-1854(-)